MGLGTQPAVTFLNDKYGSSWRAGWPHKELEYYSKRLEIIEWIKADSPRGGAVEATMEVIHEEAIHKKESLNKLATRLRKSRK